MTRRLAALALTAASILTGHATWRWAVERDTRKRLAVPKRYPERIATSRHRARLERLAAEPWPHAEYVDVIEQVRREES